MWSCVIARLPNLTLKGFKKAFVPCNVRATNDYKDRVHLAYLRNIYSQPPVVQYFQCQGGKGRSRIATRYLNSYNGSLGQR